MANDNNVELQFKTEKLRAQWQAHCGQVLQHFKLPDGRLLCGFDDEQSAWFQGIGDRDARGLHCLTQGSGSWPAFLEAHRYEDVDTAFNSLVYIPVVPPTNDAFVFVVTFAHELQHFVQCRADLRVCRASDFFRKNLPVLDPGIPAYETWRGPTERDAMIKSKEVASLLFGEEAVQVKLRSLIAGDNAGKEWQYVRGLSPSETCNLREDTARLV